MTAPEGREALVIMAKAPRAGRVKTRLATVLGDEGAAELYAHFLRDTIANAVAIARHRPRLELVLCHAPDDDPAALAPFATPATTLLAQRGADLGERIENCFRDVLDRGAASVAVVGADSPTLPVGYVVDAFAALEGGADVVLGPTVDGGYYLVGARRVYGALFRDVAWSTERVFAQTRTRASALGLSIVTLPTWYDVDEPADLERLRRELDATAIGAEATRAFLAR